jgi:hypothetical protein
MRCSPRPAVRLVAAAAVASLSACARDDAAAAREVVVRFCAAVAASDTEQARALLVAAERRDQKVALPRTGPQGSYEVQPGRLDGGRALVDVTTTGAPKPTTFVLLCEDGAWRIGLAASMSATLGDQLEHVRRMIDQAGKQMVERFEQSKHDAGKPPAPR